jgi:hypothetical protein
MTFNLDINIQVYKDLDQAIDYHSQAKAQKILNAFEDAVNFLKTNPFFAVRYNTIRCFPLGKKLPYMIHFSINENTKTVHIHALINTSKNPDTSWIK